MTTTIRVSSLSLATRLLVLGALATTSACDRDHRDDDDADDVESAARVDEQANPASGDALVAAPAGETVVATRVDVREGRTYTRTKLRADDGSTRGTLHDDRGQALASDDLPAFVRPAVDPALALAGDDEPVQVHLVLRRDTEENTARPGTAQVSLTDGKTRDFRLDGVGVRAAAVEGVHERQLAELAAREQTRVARRGDAIRELARRHGWHGDAIAATAADPQGTLVRALTRAERDEVLARSGDLVEAIEPVVAAAPSITAGLASIGVDAWAHAQGIRGANVGIFMSEAWNNCPVSPHIDPARYTNINNTPEHWHANFVGNVLARTAPDAHIFCGPYMINNPSAYSPPIRVTNHSWRYTEEGNAYGWADRDFDDATYNNRLAVFVAAGNVDDNTQTWNVGSPGRGFNSLTVGNYDAATNTMNGGSRYLNPSAGHEKPELSAPGTSVATSAGWGTGTSLSAPFSAGFAADLMSQHGWLQGHPETLKAMMMAGASRNLDGAAALSDRDGAGGINYLNTGYNGSVQWWWGGNGQVFDGTQKVTFTRWLSAGQRYRMAVAWLVPGSYAYSNNNVNMDIDMWVNTPSNGFAAGSYSYDNGFEIVDFVASESGNYTVTLNRYWNSGVGDVIMAHHTQAIY